MNANDTVTLNLQAVRAVNQYAYHRFLMIGLLLHCLRILQRDGALVSMSQIASVMSYNTRTVQIVAAQAREIKFLYDPACKSGAHRRNMYITERGAEFLYQIRPTLEEKGMIESLSFRQGDVA